MIYSAIKNISNIKNTLIIFSELTIDYIIIHEKFALHPN